MEHLCVLLYSKYSPKCKQLLKILETSPVNLTTVVGLNNVCIDNEDIREQISMATDVEISTVPTILIVYKHGGVEKYEGELVLQWIEETVRKHLPPQPPQPPPLPPPPPPRRRHRSSKQEQYNYEENNESDESEEEEEEEVPRKRKKVRPRKQKIKSKSKSETSIEELDSDGELEGPTKPLVGIRNGPGSYDMSNNFGDELPANRPKDAKTKKSATLMATAMAMQKERESTRSRNKNVNMPSQ